MAPDPRVRQYQSYLDQLSSLPEQASLMHSAPIEEKKRFVLEKRDLIAKAKQFQAQLQAEGINVPDINSKLKPVPPAPSKDKSH